VTRTTRTSTRPAAEPAPSPQPEEIEDTDQLPTLEGLATVVADLSANAAETQDAIENMQEKLDQWGGIINTTNEKIEALTRALQAGPGTRVLELPSLPLRNSATNGNNPQTLVQEHLAWIDQAILLSIVSLKLEVKDLVRLLPVEDRPRGRSTALPNSLSVDPRTGKWTSNDDNPITFDKDIPDFNTLLYILSIYGSIRTLYDTDHTGIGPAIFLYIKLLTRWVLIDKFQFVHIRAYFISHFRKYQATSNPLDWINVDIQLFTAHIRPSAIALPGTETRALTKKTIKDICNNWNTEGKGCTWDKCARVHRCLRCNSKDHPAYRCKDGDKETVKH
jgi:hypothetical protein